MRFSKVRLISFFILNSFLSSGLLAQSNTADTDSGWVQISTNIEAFQVIVNHEYANPKVVQNNEVLKYPIGGLSLTIVSPIINDWETEISVLPYDTLVIGINFSSFERNPKKSSYLVIESKQNLSLRAENGTSFFINDVKIESNSFDTLLYPGEYLVGIKNELGEIEKRKLLLNTFSKTYVEHLFEIRETRPRPFYLIPGAGYFYHRQKFKGIIQITGIALIATPIVINTLNYFDAQSLFNTYEDLYHSSSFTFNTIEYRRQADLQREKMTSARNNMLIFGVALSAFYTLTVWDSMNIGTTKFRRTTISTSIARSNTHQIFYPDILVVYDF